MTDSQVGPKRKSAIPRWSHAVDATLLPSAAPGADLLHFKGTFGARRVISAHSKACLVPAVSNRRGQGTFGGWSDGSFPPGAPMTKPKQMPNTLFTAPSVFLLSMRCCVDPLSRPIKFANLHLDRERIESWAVRVRLGMSLFGLLLADELHA
jgi:hypothetical protein